MENLIKLLIAVVFLGFALYGLRCWLERRQDDVWENRRRIGFQPNPVPANPS